MAFDSASIKALPENTKTSQAVVLHIRKNVLKNVPSNHLLGDIVVLFYIVIV